MEHAFVRNAALGTGEKLERSLCPELTKANYLSPYKRFRVWLQLRKYEKLMSLFWL